MNSGSMWSTLCFCLLLLLSVQDVRAEEDVETIALRGTWRFLPALESDKAEQVPAESAPWGRTQVPGSWTGGLIEGDGAGWPELRRGGGGAWSDRRGEIMAGWYRHEITLPEAWGSGEGGLKFGKIAGLAHVWINDRYLGELGPDGGYLSLGGNVTGGQTLRVSVQVLGPATAKFQERIQRQPTRNARGLVGGVMLIRAGEQPTESLTMIKQAKPLEVQGRQLMRDGAVWSMRVAGWPGEWPAAGTEVVASRLVERLRELHFNAVMIDRAAADDVGGWDYRLVWAEAARKAGLALIVELPAISEKVLEGDDEAVADWLADCWAEMARFAAHGDVVIWSISAPNLQHPLRQRPDLIGRGLNDPAWQALGREGWAEKWQSTERLIQELKKWDPSRLIMIREAGPVGEIYGVSGDLGWRAMIERSDWLSQWSTAGTKPLVILDGVAGDGPRWFRGRSGSAGRDMRTEPFITEYAAKVLGQEAYASEPSEYRRLIESNFESGQTYESMAWSRPIWLSEAVQSIVSRSLWRQATAWRTMGASGLVIDPWHWAGPRGGEMVIEPTIALEEVAGEADRGPAFTEVPRWIWHFLELTDDPEESQTRDRSDRRSRDEELSGLIENDPRPGRSEAFFHGRTQAGEWLEIANRPVLAWLAGDETSGWQNRRRHYYAGDVLKKQVVLINDSAQEQRFQIETILMIGTMQLTGRMAHGVIAPGERLKLPFQFTLPDIRNAADASIRLVARFGEETRLPIRDEMAIRMVPKLPDAVRGEVLIFDPNGGTTAALMRIGIRTQRWDGEPSPLLLVIGRDALSHQKQPPGDLEKFVQQGGRILVFAQRPDWLVNQAGFRVSGLIDRRVFPVSLDHPALIRLQTGDLSDWLGGLDDDWDSAEQATTTKGPGRYGWTINRRQAVAISAIEKPHRAGWRPILQSGFDHQYSPLMELDYGSGRIIWSQLTLEENVGIDPMVSHFMEQLMHYVATTPLAPRREKVIYSGSDAGESLLKKVGVNYRPGNLNEALDADILIVGPESELEDSDLLEVAVGGGRILVLARKAARGPLDIRRIQTRRVTSPTVLPDWRELSGLSASDIRWRVDRAGLFLQNSVDYTPAAGGQIAERRIGSGIVVVLQVDPELLNAQEKTYMRLTEKRQYRMISQILSNLGAGFAADGRLFRRSEDQPEPPLYLPDYREDFELGDDPYRHGP